MAIQALKITATGINPLLLNNPQTVDPTNVYARQMKVITNKKKGRTDEDLRRLKDLEIRAKIYWNDDIGIYVPSTWLIAAIGGWSYKRARISKADIRSSVFATEDKIKLVYKGMESVKTPEDIVGNDMFREIMTIKQKQVRVVKAIPIFSNWSFSTELEFDDTVIDPQTLELILTHLGKYGGFGDFRPTFGRALVECEL